MVEVYETFSPVVEVYSIDESFLDFGGFRDREAHGQEMRKQVLLQVGVPVRVGYRPDEDAREMRERGGEAEPDLQGGPGHDGPVRGGLGPAARPGRGCLGCRRSDEGEARPPGGPHGGGAARHAGPPGARSRLRGSGADGQELQGEACIPLDEAPPPRKGMAVIRSAERRCGTWRRW